MCVQVVGKYWLARMGKLKRRTSFLTLRFLADTGFRKFYKEYLLEDQQALLPLILESLSFPYLNRDTDR